MADWRTCEAREAPTPLTSRVNKWCAELDHISICRFFKGNAFVKYKVITNSARSVKFGVLVLKSVNNIPTQCVRNTIEVNDYKFGEKSSY
jgi:hypothetical protein